MLLFLTAISLVIKHSLSAQENYDQLNSLIKDQFQQFKSLNSNLRDDEILQIYKRISSQKSNDRSLLNDDGNLLNSKSFMEELVNHRQKANSNKKTLTNKANNGDDRQKANSKQKNLKNKTNNGDDRQKANSNQKTQKNKANIGDGKPIPEGRRSFTPKTEIEIVPLGLTKDKINTFSLRLSNGNRCTGDRKVRCGIVCHCFGGKEYCCRQRKSWDALTSAEKLRYVQLVLTIANGKRGRSLQREYRNFIRIHERYWSTGIHGRVQFFPWHRLFLLRYENLLRKADCEVTVPYWDWTKQPNRWYEHNVFGRSYFGSNLGRRGDQCTRTGAFTPDEFRDLRGNCLVRNFRYSTRPATYARIQTILGFQDFRRFETGLRLEHGVPHYMIGGDGRALFFDQRSAEEPLFFVHHSNVDYQWYQRQVRYTTDSNGLYKEFWGTPKIRVRTLNGLGSRISRVVNPYNHDGVCVEYVEEDNRYKEYVTQRRFDQLNKNCDVNASPFPKAVFTLFKTTKATEQQFLHDRQGDCEDSAWPLRSPASRTV